MKKPIGLASARPSLKTFEEGLRILAWHMSLMFQNRDRVFGLNAFKHS